MITQTLYPVTNWTFYAHLVLLLAELAIRIVLLKRILNLCERFDLQISHRLNLFSFSSLLLGKQRLARNRSCVSQIYCLICLAPTYPVAKRKHDPADVG